MADEVLVAQRGGVATVTLNRPEKLNAMTTSLLDGLATAIEDLTDTPGVSVIVVRGAGRGFCVGGDLEEIAKPSHPQRQTSLLRRHVRAAELLRTGAAVSIAAVHGPCAGAGFSIAAACDFRVAAESAVFRSAFRTAGLAGDFGLAWSLTHLVGSGKAREFMLLDQKLSGAQALEAGLVTQCVADDELDTTVASMADDLASAAPLALRAIKENLNDAPEIGFPEALRRECDRHIGTACSEDATEAGSAFLEKRSPVFAGR